MWTTTSRAVQDYNLHSEEDLRDALEKHVGDGNFEIVRDLDRTRNILHKWVVESPDLPRPSAKDLEIALVLAAENGYVEIVKYLLDNGAEITPTVTRSPGDFKSSDVEANTAILQTFLEHGWAVNMVSDIGRPALWYSFHSLAFFLFQANTKQLRHR